VTVILAKPREPAAPANTKQGGGLGFVTRKYPCTRKLCHEAVNKSKPVYGRGGEAIPVVSRDPGQQN